MLDASPRKRLFFSFCPIQVNVVQILMLREMITFALTSVGSISLGHQELGLESGEVGHVVAQEEVVGTAVPLVIVEGGDSKITGEAKESITASIQKFINDM